jgi:hypothetical protein
MNRQTLILFGLLCCNPILSAQEVRDTLATSPQSADSILHSIALDEVVVKANKTFHVTNEGLVAHVTGTPLQTEPNILTLLGKIPLLTLSNGSVTVIGKGAPMYYINNRPAVDTSEVENLQPDEILNVTVMLTPSVKYRSNGQPVILIRTKNKQDGWKLDARVNGTQAHRLSHNERLNLSYQRNVLNLYAGYLYQDTYSKNLEKYAERLYTDTIRYLSTNKTGRSNQSAHRFNAGMGLTWDKHAVELKYVGQYSDNSGFFHSLMDATNNRDERSSSITTGSNSRGTQNNHQLNLFYKGTWKRLTFLFNASYVRQNSNSNGIFQEQDTERGDREVTSSVESAWNIYAFDGTLEYQTPKAGTFTLGGAFSWVNGYNRVVNTQALNNGYNTNREQKQSAFLTYDYTPGDFSFNAGLRVVNWQPNVRNNSSDIQIDKNYLNLYPSLRVTYTKGELYQQLAYAYEQTRPPFNEWNDNSVYTDRFHIHQGNKALVSSIGHGLTYSLFYKQWMLFLAYSHTKNIMWTDLSVNPDKSSVAIERWANYPSLDDLRLTGYYNPTIKKWQPTLGFTLMRAFFSYTGADGEKLRSKNPMLSLYFQNSLQLPKEWYLFANFTYSSAGDYYNLHSKPNWKLDFSIRKTFLKQTLQVSLDAYDLFHRDNSRYTGAYRGVWKYTDLLPDSRKVGVTVSYRLFKKHRAPTDSNAAQEEMNRL